MAFTLQNPRNLYNKFLGLKKCRKKRRLSVKYKELEKSFYGDWTMSFKYSGLGCLVTTAMVLLNGNLIADDKIAAPEMRNLLPPDEGVRNYTIALGFLCEQARITGTQYAYTKVGYAQGAAGVPAAGRTVEPTFNLNWGITADLAYYFGNKNWTLNARFDWLSSTGRSHKVAESTENIIPIHIWRDQFFSAISQDLGVAGEGRSRFDTSYYNLNLDLNRALYIDKNFTLEPNMGLRLSCIYEDVDTSFTGNGSDKSFPSSTQLNSNVLSRDQKALFWGVGPSLGINSDWNMAWDFSLFLEGSIAVLLGYSQAHDKVSYTGFAKSYTLSGIPSAPMLSPVMQTLLGLKYERGFCQDKHKIIARLGWDTSIFWNQWNHINVVSEATYNTSLDTFQLQEGNTFGLTGILFDLAWNF